jgi:MerR family transcriptional regulator/heat shock protein HspR
MSTPNGAVPPRPDNQPRYVLHIAAQLVGLPPRRFRHLERVGVFGGDLGSPRRGRPRPLYTDADLDRVRLILRLVDDLGVNLAGAEVILNMRQRMIELRAELDQLRRSPGTG